MYESLCCPSVYITWSHFRSVWVSMMSELICELVSFRYVWVFVLSDFLCQLVSFPSCMGLCVVLVSMSVGFTSVLYGSLLSECLWYVVSLPFYMGIYAVPSFYLTWSHFDMHWSLCCLILYVDWCHLVLCGSLYYLSFYVAWFHLVLCGSLWCLSFYVALFHLVLCESLCCPSLYVTCDYVTFGSRSCLLRQISLSVVNNLISANLYSDSL